MSLFAYRGIRKRHLLALRTQSLTRHLLVLRAQSLIGLLLLFSPRPLWADERVGVFETHGDVGKPARAGAVEYDAERKIYLVTGGGKNMWGQEDAFHFVWKRMSGDVALTASIRWPSPGKE